MTMATNATTPDREAFLRRLENNNNETKEETKSPGTEEALQYLESCGLTENVLDNSSLEALRELCSPIGSGGGGGKTSLLSSPPPPHPASSSSDIVISSPTQLDIPPVVSTGVASKEGTSSKTESPNTRVKFRDNVSVASFDADSFSPPVSVVRPTNQFLKKATSDISVDLHSISEEDDAIPYFCRNSMKEADEHHLQSGVMSAGPGGPPSGAGGGNSNSPCFLNYASFGKDSEFENSINLSEATTFGSSVGARQRFIRDEGSITLTDATTVGSRSNISSLMDNSIDMSNVNVNRDDLWRVSLMDQLEAQTAMLTEMRQQITSLTQEMSQLRRQVSSALNNNGIQQHQQAPLRGILRMPTDRSLDSSIGKSGSGTGSGSGTQTRELPPATASQDATRAVEQQQARQAPPAALGEPQAQQQQEQQQQQMFIFAFFTNTWNYLKELPQQLQSNSVLRRLGKIMVKFAEEHQRHVRLDFSLLMKVMFVIAILGSRMSTKKRKGGKGSIFDAYRMHMTVGVVLVGFLVQSGYIAFLHHFFWKENYVMRIWNEENNNQGGNQENSADGNNNDEGNNNNNGRARAIPGQPQVQQQLPPRPVPRQAAAEEAREPNWIRQNVVAGAIMPRAQGGFLTLVTDILYVFATFFLSLVPTWRPEMVEREPLVPQQQHEEPHGDNEGDSDDGEGDSDEE